MISHTVQELRWQAHTYTHTHERTLLITYQLRYTITASNYVEPRLCTKFGERAFSFAGPHAWNQLPATLRATSNLNWVNSFKKQLKTHLFNIAFSHWSSSIFILYTFYSMNYCNAPLAIFANRALKILVWWWWWWWWWGLYDLATLSVHGW